MTIFVQQRARSDCVIAAIAMATGRSYEDVLAAAGKNYRPRRYKGRGSGTYNVGEVLSKLGREQDNIHGRKSPGDFRSLYVPWGISGDLLRAWIWGRRALLCVPSLNLKGGSHMIYYDGHEIHDPNPPHKKRYSDFESLSPTDAYVFREPLGAG